MRESGRILIGLRAKCVCGGDWLRVFVGLSRPNPNACICGRPLNYILEEWGDAPEEDEKP